MSDYDETYNNENFDKNLSVKYWVFVWNNYTNEDVEYLTSIICGDDIRYIIFGKEIGESGTHHLQGYIIFKTNKKYLGVKKILDPEKGKLSKVCVFPSKQEYQHQAINYCKKGNKITKKEWEESKIHHPNYGIDADIYECGKLSINGSHNQSGLAVFNANNERYRQVYDEHIENATNIKDVLKAAPDIGLKHYWAIKDIIKDNKEISALNELKEYYKNFKPLKWQQNILNIINGEVNQRAIYWITDYSPIWGEQGGYGKSYFSKYLSIMYEIDFFNNCKTTDVAHMITYAKIAIFNFVKSAEDHINYEILEQVKDGFLSSPKYSGQTKRWLNPHMFIFSNDMPDIKKFSNPDRLIIIHLKPEDRNNYI